VKLPEPESDDEDDGALRQIMLALQQAKSGTAQKKKQKARFSQQICTIVSEC